VARPIDNRLDRPFSCFRAVTNSSQDAILPCNHALVILRILVFHSIEKQVASAFHAHIQIRYGIDLAVGIEQPRQSEFGEMAVPAAFQLAKQLRQAPRKIAAELVEEIGPIPGVAAMEVAGNGYINIRLDRGAYAETLLRGESETLTGADEKIIVEHTNINPNKAAHIGHLRNATLGDTFVRMLRSRGHRVEVQNYIDNTGVQVADVVVGFHYLEHLTPTDVRTMLADPAVRFDYYCWDLYARTSSYYKDHPESLNWRAATLHAIEAGEGEVAELAHLVADAIVQAHLKTCTCNSGRRLSNCSRNARLSISRPKASTPAAG